MPTALMVHITGAGVAFPCGVSAAAEWAQGSRHACFGEQGTVDQPQQLQEQ